MKDPARLVTWLDHIKEHAERVGDYVARAGDKAAFLADDLLVDGIARRVEIIGEAVTRIKDHFPQFCEAHPEVPWRGMKDMRNNLIHGYDRVNADLLWRTASHSVPVLLDQVSALREAAPSRVEREES